MNKPFPQTPVLTDEEIKHFRAIDRVRYGDIEVTEAHWFIDGLLKAQARASDRKRDKQWIEKIKKTIMAVAKAREENLGSQRGWVTDLLQALKGGM